MAGRPPDGVLLLDKPIGFSSTQALGRAKRLLGAAKAGHTGTLDPFATGLLPLVFGEATKFSRFLIDATKAYTATLRLGIETTTGDPEGEVTTTRPVHVILEQIDEVLGKFSGAQDQIPPMYSAVRIGGKRLYDLARAGVEIERPARRIHIGALERVHLDGDELVVSVVCSKGTYVRTLAIGIGTALGCGAHLAALRRTGVGRFTLEAATDMPTLEGLGMVPARSRLLPVETLVAELPRWDAPADLALRFTQGQVVAREGGAEAGEVALFAPDGRFLGVGGCGSRGAVTPLRLMATGDNAKLPDFA